MHVQSSLIKWQFFKRESIIREREKLIREQDGRLRANASSLGRICCKRERYEATEPVRLTREGCISSWSHKDGAHRFWQKFIVWIGHWKLSKGTITACTRELTSGKAEHHNVWVVESNSEPQGLPHLLCRYLICTRATHWILLPCHHLPNTCQWGHCFPQADFTRASCCVADAFNQDWSWHLCYLKMLSSQGKMKLQVHGIVLVGNTLAHLADSSFNCRSSCRQN